MRQINRDILKLAVPSILANITVPIVGMVDIAVAGHLDASAATLIGGIAVGSMLFDLLYFPCCLRLIFDFTIYDGIFYNAL